MDKKYVNFVCKSRLLLLLYLLLYLIFEREFLQAISEGVYFANHKVAAEATDRENTWVQIDVISVYKRKYTTI